ncbi:MAG: LysM peptidoglycan-binding domain-containing protein [Deltaproteobacteria bacterium]|nr:LysM peptidoglycan-binding domain-containing protein [Deltaproteobacteria bacterium]
MRRFLMLLAAALLLPASGLLAQTSDFGPAPPYVVQKGDTAAGIARRVYGKPALGEKLWEANRNLVAHPNKLTPGDTIYLFPEATLQAGKRTAVPPPPIGEPSSLYERGRLFTGSFPKYFNFLTDSRGLGESGSVRVTVKRENPHNGQIIDSLYEVRNVGQILASSYHNTLYFGDGADKARGAGKTIMSTNDDVMVVFTEDLAKILDSDTYGDSDPYFREFPIYGQSGPGSRGPNPKRVDRGQTLGELYVFKGLVTIVARVEGLAPLPPKAAKALKRKKRGVTAGQGMEPVSYVGRITYAEDAVELNDHVFAFVPLSPGPERVLDPPLVEPPDSYVSLGN